jgi:hypothetical protein
MNRIPVDSSAIASVGYDAATATLEVEITTGRIYQYFDVPEATHQAFMSAESIGVFYNKVIKEQFRYAQV